MKTKLLLSLFLRLQKNSLTLQKREDYVIKKYRKTLLEVVQGLYKSEDSGVTEVDIVPLIEIKEFYDFSGLDFDENMKEGERGQKIE